MRWSRKMAVLAVMVVTAAPVGAAAATDGGAASTAERTAPWCASGDLKARFKVTDAAAGTAYGKMILKNRSDHACRLGGYGGLSYVGGGDGTQIGAAADREGSWAPIFRLAPGDRARSRVAMVNAENYSRRECRPRPVDGFRLYVPESTRAKFVPFETVGCMNADIHLLRHRSYRKI